MAVRKLVLIVIALYVCACTLLAQDKGTEIKHVPIKATSPVSGKEMYNSYCAVCHGTDGKGAGPAASALKVPPTDLTTLAKNNGGKYPTMKVTASIHGENTTAAHGTKEMPVWGSLFWNMSGGHEGEVQQRVSNLNKYIESLQAK